jgi:hypothetical protein
MDRRQLTIARETGALLEKFPEIRDLDSRIDHWREGGTPLYSACLDIRLDQCQLLVSGPPMPKAAAAARAAFAEARELLVAHARRGSGARATSPA